MPANKGLTLRISLLAVLLIALLPLASATIFTQTHPAENALKERLPQVSAAYTEFFTGHAMIVLDHGQNKMVLHGVEHPGAVTVAHVEANHERRQGLTTDIAVSDANVRRAMITLEKHGDVAAIVRCADYSEGECRSGWEETGMPFTDQGTTVTFEVTGFSAYGGINQSTRMYATKAGTNTDTVPVTASLATARAGTQDIARHTDVAATTLYMFLNASGTSLDSGIIKTTDTINFSAHWTHGGRVNQAYATYQLWAGPAGDTLVCQAGNNGTGGADIIGGGLITSSCSPTTNTTINEGDTLRYVINLWVEDTQAGGGGNPRQVDLSYDTATHDTWVQVVSEKRVHTTISTEPAYNQSDNVTANGTLTWHNGSAVVSADVEVGFYDPEGTLMQLRNVTTNNSGEYEDTYALAAAAPTGTWTVNATGRYNETLWSVAETTFEVYDPPPTIRAVEISPNPAANGTTATILANVTDNHGVDSVWAKISYPNGTLWQNLTMSGPNPFTTTFTVPETPLGNYTVTVKTNDSQGSVSTATANLVPYITISQYEEITIDGNASDWPVTMPHTHSPVSGTAFWRPLDWSGDATNPKLAIDLDYNDTTTSATIPIGSQNYEFLLLSGTTSATLEFYWEHWDFISVPHEVTVYNHSSEEYVQITGTAPQCGPLYCERVTYELTPDLISPEGHVGVSFAGDGVDIYDLYITTSGQTFDYRGITNPSSSHIANASTHLNNSEFSSEEYQNIWFIGTSTANTTEYDVVQHEFNIMTGYLEGNLQLEWRGFLNGTMVSFYIQVYNVTNSSWNNLTETSLALSNIDYRIVFEIDSDDVVIDNNRIAARIGTESAMPVTLHTDYFRINTQETPASSNIKNTSLANDKENLYALIQVSGEISEKTTYRTYVGAGAGSNVTPEGAPLPFPATYIVNYNGTCSVMNMSLEPISNCTAANDSNTLELAVPLDALGAGVDDMLNVTFETRDTSRQDIVPAMSSFIQYTIDPGSPLSIDVISDESLYLPEDTVLVTGNFTEEGTGLSGKDVTVTFLNTTGGVVQQRNVTTNSTGGYNDSYDLGGTADLGLWTVEVTGWNDTETFVSANATFIVEDNRPVITNVTNTSITETSVNITWNTNVEANSSLEYGTTNSLGAIGNISATNNTDHELRLYGLTPNTTYYYNATSCNDYGCDTSGPYNFTTLPDTTPPIVVASAPINNSGTNGSDVTFTYTATDNIGVNSCSLIINGDVEQVIISAPFEEFVIASPPVGNHDWHINCSDATGNSAVSLNRTFTVINATGLNIPDLSTADMRSVEGFTINHNTGSITYNDPLDLSQGADLNENTASGTGWIYVDSVAEPVLDSSANITLNGLPFTQTPIIYRDGSICNDCTSISYVAGTFSFTVTGFSNYSAGENSELAIWDDSESMTIETDEPLTFYANYTNITSNNPITGATCTFREDSTGGWSSPEPMGYNATTGLYEYTTIIATEGTHQYEVSCDGSSEGYEPLTLTDTFTISASIPSGTCVGVFTEKGPAYLEGYISPGDVFEYFCELPTSVGRNEEIDIQIFYPNGELRHIVTTPRMIYGQQQVMYP